MREKRREKRTKHPKVSALLQDDNSCSSNAGDRRRRPPHQTPDTPGVRAPHAPRGGVQTRDAPSTGGRAHHPGVTPIRAAGRCVSPSRVELSLPRPRGPLCPASVAGRYASPGPARRWARSRCQHVGSRSYIRPVISGDLSGPWPTAPHYGRTRAIKPWALSAVVT